jgi:predicted deacetylase
MGRTLAIALHDIEPATYTRCALIRDWLYDHGVERVTLLVIPARDLHPVAERCPEMIEWLQECRRRGDAIGQHGFQHVQLRASPLAVRLTRRGSQRRAAEFLGLDPAETRRAVQAGWRLLRLAGLEPSGFVAPGYVYTPALNAALAERFRWWAGLLQVHHRTPSHAQATLAPAWSLAPGGRVAGLVSPTLVRVGARTAGSTLRLDLYPSDVRHPRHMLALEAVLRRARDRRAVTYNDLVTD